ncbi:MAG: DUF222 domain-containing protein [Marmoricola sp.]
MREAVTAMAMAPEAGVHPLLSFARALDGALDKAATHEPLFLPAEAKAALLIELHRQEQRLAALRLRVMAASADVADAHAARDVAAWLAHATRTDCSPADLRLAEAVDRTWTRVGAGVAEGRVNLAQAHVIVRALEALPDDLEAELVVKAEEHLVELAATYPPAVLKKLGRRILEVVAPDIAEAEEGRQLQDKERRARETTRREFKRLGDGSTRITLKVPDGVADRFRTYLDAFTSPRHGTGADGGGVVEVPDVPAGDRIPAARKRGLAFAALLEHLDPQKLPDHGGDATTVMVTLSLDQLRSGLGAAGVITSAHGDISATEARRLACTAHLIPAVLGSKGEILDLGRRARLFSPAQHRALRLRDRGCRAEGCTVPVTWTEAHHWEPWSHGGTTDLANAVSLCNFHHHRVHDNGFAADRLSNGDVRFRRRT